MTIVAAEATAEDPVVQAATTIVNAVTSETTTAGTTTAPATNAAAVTVRNVATTIEAMAAITTGDTSAATEGTTTTADESDMLAVTIANAMPREPVLAVGTNVSDTSDRGIAILLAPESLLAGLLATAMLHLGPRRASRTEVRMTTECCAACSR